MSPFPTAIPFHSSSSSISTPFNTQRPYSLHTLIPYHPPLSLFLIPPPSQAPPIFLNLNWVQKNGSSSILGRPQSLLSRKSEGFASSDNCDRELRIVLELATESELYELERILFGKSYFSPLLKSIAKREDIDYVMIEEDPEEREEYIGMLESRFFYLAADARSTLRGWRPSYRSVLLDVRKLLNIRCSAKLPTEDLEAEIFLHLLQEYSTGESGMFSHANENLKISESDSTLEHGLDKWKVQVAAALRRGPGEIKSMVLKGSGMLTLGKMYDLLASSLSGKVFQEAAKYQIKKELIKKGGQLAAISLESRAALVATRKGLAVAASRYLGLRSMMQLLGPMLWGTLLADVVIQMLGTDYARILRAIYALAQIRILRTYR